MPHMYSRALATEQVRVLFLSAQGAVASQVAHMAVARHFKPEIQQICVEARDQAKALGTVPQAVLPDDAARLPLTERMKRLLQDTGPLLDHESDGITYRYFVKSGTRPMPSETMREMEMKVDALNNVHRRYGEASRLLEGAKMELHSKKSSAPITERLSEYAKAHARYHGARVGYHEHIRAYLGDRASLASRGYDVSRTDSRAQYFRVFDYFMRDCRSMLKTAEPTPSPAAKNEARSRVNLG